MTFERDVRQVVEHCQFWKEFADVPEVAIDTQEIALTWIRAREAVKALLATKESSLLEPVAISQDAKILVEEHRSNCRKVASLSAELALANERLELVKERARDADAATLASDLKRLKAIEARFDVNIAPLCDSYLDEKTAKAVTEMERTEARATLDLHRDTAFAAYGDTIND